MNTKLITGKNVVMAKLSPIQIDLPKDGSLPMEIQFMPPGEHTITGTKNGEPFTTKAKATPEAAVLIDGYIKHYLQKAEAGEGDVPYIDFNHDDDEAAGHPVGARWGGDDLKTGGIRLIMGDWSKAGGEKVLGKSYRRFSPNVVYAEDGTVLGTPLNMGGLVNRAAFKKIAPVMAKSSIDFCAELLGVSPEFLQSKLSEDGNTQRSSQPGGTPPPTQAKASMTEQEMQAAIAAKDKEIGDLKGKITNIEGLLVTQAKDNAKVVVAAAVAAGKIEPKNAALITHYEELLVTAPVQAKAIIDALPVNPAFLPVIEQPGNGGTVAQAKGKEHEFIVKAKEMATKENITEAKAQEKIARTQPQLYQAWRDSLNG